MAPVRSDPHWRSDNRPDFPGIAVWLDDVGDVGEVRLGHLEHLEFDDDARSADAEFEDSPVGAPGSAATGSAAAGLEDPGAGTESVPWPGEAGTPDDARAWQPFRSLGREPRPGLLMSVVRAGRVTAYPTPPADPPTRSRRPVPVPRILTVDPGAARRGPEPSAPRKDYADVRALVGVLIEVLAGNRAPLHAAVWTTPEVRGKLRLPRFTRTARLKSVRLSDSGDGVEALALVRDGSRVRAVALRFDRADGSRWRCTALQAG